MKNKKKGFTLVELIVVLAILAILAAMLVPALTGYIDKANEKKIVAQARQAVVAAQTIASEEYANNKTLTDKNSTITDGRKLSEAVAKLGEVNVDNIVSITVDGKGNITKLEYRIDATGKLCTYQNGTYTVAS